MTIGWHAWLEVFDHRQRRHSALGSLSPATFEAQAATLAAT